MDVSYIKQNHDRRVQNEKKKQSYRTRKNKRYSQKILPASSPSLMRRDAKGDAPLRLASTRQEKARPTRAVGINIRFCPSESGSTYPVNTLLIRQRISIWGRTKKCTCMCLDGRLGVPPRRQTAASKRKQEKAIHSPKKEKQNRVKRMIPELTATAVPNGQVPTSFVRVPFRSLAFSRPLPDNRTTQPARQDPVYKLHNHT